MHKYKIPLTEVDIKLINRALIQYKKNVRWFKLCNVTQDALADGSGMYLKRDET